MRNTHVCRNVGALLCLEVLFHAEYVILIIIEIIWQKTKELVTEVLTINAVSLFLDIAVSEKK